MILAGRPLEFPQADPFNTHRRDFFFLSSNDLETNPGGVGGEGKKNVPDLKKKQNTNTYLAAENFVADKQTRTHTDVSNSQKCPKSQQSQKE